MKNCVLYFTIQEEGEKKNVSGLEYFQHLGWQVNFKQNPAGKHNMAVFSSLSIMIQAETAAGGESTFSQIFPNSLRH